MTGAPQYFMLKQRIAFQTLIAVGANPLLMDYDQVDLVRCATWFRSELDERTSFDEEIERVCGIPLENLEQLRQSFSDMIRQQAIVACASNMKLLILMGETHFLYRVLQMEEILLQVAYEHGIKKCLSERDPNDEEPPYPTDIYAEELGMTVAYIDVNASSGDMDQRNTGMTKKIFDLNQDAIVRTGSSHLKGLLEMPNSEVNQDNFYARFHVIPLSLFKYITPPNEYSFFSDDPTNVVQVSDGSFFSDVHPVVEKWNSKKEDKLDDHQNEHSRNIIHSNVMSAQRKRDRDDNAPSRETKRHKM